MQYSDNEILSAKKISEIIHVSPQTVRNYMKAGLIRSSKIGNRSVVTGMELRRFIVSLSNKNNDDMGA